MPQRNIDAKINEINAYLTQTEGIYINYLLFMHHVALDTQL